MAPDQGSRFYYLYSKLSIDNMKGTAEVTTEVTTEVTAEYDLYEAIQTSFSRFHTESPRLGEMISESV